MEDAEDKTEQQLTPDLAELNKLCGCTEKQLKFVEAMLQGMNYSEAALHAGYAGEAGSVAIRSAGSSAARAKPVQALLALAESRGLGIPSAPGDMEELRRILWTHARSKQGKNSIDASRELRRIEDQDKATKHVAPDPREVLQEIADIMPAVAVVLAAKENIKFALNENQQASYEAFRRKIAIEYIEEQRSKAQVSSETTDNGQTGSAS